MRLLSFLHVLFIFMLLGSSNALAQLADFTVPYVSPDGSSPINVSPGYQVNFEVGVIDENTTEKHRELEMGIYISDDNQLDAGDQFIRQEDYETSTKFRYLIVDSQVEVIIPSNTSLGAKYILFVADYTHLISESNENNNVTAVSINVINLPDLILAETSYSPRGPGGLAVPGNTIYVGVDVNNIGLPTTQSSLVHYYISKKRFLDESAIFLASDVTRNGFGEDGAFPTLPLNLCAGEYYIIYVVDALDDIEEADENK